METALFTVLLVAHALLSARLVNGYRARDATLFAVASLLLGLARPEGNLFAAVSSATLLLLLPRERRVELLKRLVLWYALPGAAYFAWRWAYYGLPLPLPFYVKVGDPKSLPGLLALKEYGLQVGILVPL